MTGVRYDVQAPVKGYNGETGGVRFYKGRAHVDGAENPAAVAYFRRRGYTLTPIREEQPEQSEEQASEDTPPADPAQTEESQEQSGSDSEPPACECEEKPCEHTPKGEALVKPKQGDDKATWIAYTVVTTDLTEAEAKDLTKAELIELAEAEKEQTS